MSNRLSKLWKSNSIVFVVLVVAAIISIMAPRFFQFENLMNVLSNASVVAVVGLGMTLAIASGNFDLSVGSTAAFASCVSFSLVPVLGIPLSILAGLITGAVVGLVNGAIITELRVPAFIATLGMQTIVRGLSLIYTNGKDLYLYGSTGYKILSGDSLGLPMPLILALVIAIILALVVGYTRFGRHVLALGSNFAAAKRSGVQTTRVIWGVFAIVGVVAALSGMIVSAQVLTANGRLSTGLELSAIAVVVLGGTPLSGGKLTFLGTLMGAFLIAIINNGLNLLNIPIFYQELTVGALMLIALAINLSQGFKLSSLVRRAQ
jgi:ribose/xylose/arabinose/galactoside ABC-type transport system permease subunit